MLSDEEKKKYEEIKYNNGYLYCDKEDVDCLIDIIEKQSKEIEELKENNKQKYYHLVKSNELEEEINNAWENKINEKIEEYEEILAIIKDDYKREVKHIISVLEELKGDN